MISWMAGGVLSHIDSLIRLQHYECRVKQAINRKIAPAIGLDKLDDEAANVLLFGLTD